MVTLSLYPIPFILYHTIYFNAIYFHLSTMNCHLLCSMLVREYHCWIFVSYGVSKWISRDPVIHRQHRLYSHRQPICCYARRKFQLFVPDTSPNGARPGSLPVSRSWRQTNGSFRARYRWYKRRGCDVKNVANIILVHSGKVKPISTSVSSGALKS